jgi:pyruvate kinase
MLRQLMLAGLDVARLNFSHGDHAEHAENIARIHSVAAELDKPVAILADLQGPKLRVGTMVKGGVLLEEGQEAILTTEPVIGRTPDALPVQYRGLARCAKPGDLIWIDDGLLELRVLSTTRTEVRCQVLVGGVLNTNKGMNLPRTPADIPSITDKDRTDLAFALEQGVDWIALSFVRTADEVRELKELIAGHASNSARAPGERVPVMAKIEKPEALENIDAIIDGVDAIMVARGDLGIEIRPEEVPMAQKRIIEACNRAGVPVVTATQMLDSMIRNPRPTRAEASDVANAILDGTDAIMLSGETSIGAYPVHAVRTMERIAIEVEAHCPKTYTSPSPVLGNNGVLTIAEAVSHAARAAAHDLGAAAIIAPTSSGYTARMMSRHRPRTPILAVTPDRRVQRQLALCWGVTSLFAPRTADTDEMLDYAVQAARERGLVQGGDTVVLTGGAAGSPPGTTNLLRVLVVE